MNHDYRFDKATRRVVCVKCDGVMNHGAQWPCPNKKPEPVVVEADPFDKFFEESFSE